jgi:hypothetical protein
MHPGRRGAAPGRVTVELWLLTAAAADAAPAGEGQSPPNVDPTLVSPLRNPPAYAWGSNLINSFQRRKTLALCLCVAAITLPVLVPILLLYQGDSVATG